MLTVCNQIKNGAVAIFGPTNPAMSEFVKSATNTFHVPHIQIHPHRQSVDNEEDYMDNLDFTIRMSPSYRHVTAALTDYIESLKWQSFTLIYERSEGEIVRTYNRVFVAIVLDCTESVAKSSCPFFSIDTTTRTIQHGR